MDFFWSARPVPAKSTLLKLIYGKRARNERPTFFVDGPRDITRFARARDSVSASQNGRGISRFSLDAAKKTVWEKRCFRAASHRRARKKSLVREVPRALENRPVCRTKPKRIRINFPAASKQRVAIARAIVNNPQVLFSR